MRQLKEARIKLLQFSEKNKISSDKTFAYVFFDITKDIVRDNWVAPEFINMMCDSDSGEPSDDWFDTVELNSKRNDVKKGFIKNTLLACDLIDRTIFAAQKFLNKSADQRKAHVKELLKIKHTHNGVDDLSKTIQSSLGDKRCILDSASDNGNLIELSAYVAIFEVYQAVEKAYHEHLRAAEKRTDNNKYHLFTIYRNYLILILNNQNLNLKSEVYTLTG